MTPELPVVYPRGGLIAKSLSFQKENQSKGKKKTIKSTTQNSFWK
jgi:hypothetical protein